MGILDGRVAIVTGAGRGIGRADALLLAGEGARVVVNDLGVALDGAPASGRPAEEVAGEIREAGGEAVASFDDVASWDGGALILQAALDAFGRLDILVNNAGILRDRMIFTMSEEDWDAVVRVHLKGHFVMTRHACAHWRARAKAGEPVAGRIVNTSSGAGLAGNLGQANYAAAKAGILAFTRVVAWEMERYGVTCNAIAPGFTRTRMTEGLGEPPPAEFDTAAPENIAPLVAFLASDAAAGITGRVFQIWAGSVQLWEGWQLSAEITKDGPWTVGELMERVPGELMERVPGELVERVPGELVKDS